MQKSIALEKLACRRYRKLPPPTLLSLKNITSWFELLGRKLSELVSELLYIKDSSLSGIYIKFLQIKLDFNALGTIAIQFLF